MEKLYTFILTLLWVELAVNSTTTANPRKPVFTSTPGTSNPVLVGRDIKLEWSFKFQSVNDLAEIIVFRYDLRPTKKQYIAKKIVKSGEFKYKSGIKDYKKRYVCEISFTNRTGRASISISNLQFNHPYDYGVILKMTEEHLAPVEKSCSVKVVDMIRGDKRRDSRIIRLWFGQKHRLKCDVVYHRNITPKFEWFKKSLTGDTEQKLSVPNNTKILAIKIDNTTDFGEYICAATSPKRHVRQKFRVHKLGYAGSPRKIDYKYYPTSRSYALYWEQPSTKDGHWVRKYVLEEWKENEATWVQRLNITTLHVTIKNIKSTTKYRVCAANEIGYKETSCSKSVELAKTEKPVSSERGKSNQFWPSLCLILVMAFLPGVLPGHH